MKNIFLPKVMMCIIALFTLILPASAQNTNATDEYKETLKKIMDFPALRLLRMTFSKNYIYNEIKCAEKG